MNEETLFNTLLELVTRTSTELPEDVLGALRQARTSADANGVEATTLNTMLDNVALAKERRLPVCQDTGTLNFFVEAPPSGRA